MVWVGSVHCRGRPSGEPVLIVLITPAGLLPGLATDCTGEEGHVFLPGSSRAVSIR